MIKLVWPTRSALPGAVFGITSEPQSLAREAESAWDFSFPMVGDPHHEIREALSQRDWPDVFFIEDVDHLRSRRWASHPKSYDHPAVNAVDRSL